LTPYAPRSECSAFLQILYHDTNSPDQFGNILLADGEDLFGIKMFQTCLVNQKIVGA